MIYVLVLRRSKQSRLDSTGGAKVTMSSLQDTRSVGVTNPAAIGFPSGNEDEEDDEKGILENSLYDDVPRS